MARYDKSRAAQKGLPIGRPETHAWNSFFDKDGNAITQEHPDDYTRRPGDGPLIKKKYLTKAGDLGSKAKVDDWVVSQITQDPNAIFSLTGGFYPTFTDPSGGGLVDWYSASNAGFVTVTESFNSAGPGRIKLRGNNIWYQYAANYVPTIQKLYGTDEDVDGTPDMLDPAYSVLEDIFLKYMNWVKQPQTTDGMMTSWREAMGENIAETAQKEYLDKEGFIDPSTHEVVSTGSSNLLKGDISEAPEELIPKVLKAKFPDLFSSLDEISVALEDAGGNSMDIAFKFMDQLYIKEVTQERLTEGVSHTSVLQKFKISNENLGELTDTTSKGYTSLRKDLLTHFTENRKALNDVLIFIQEQHTASKSDKLLRDFAKEDLGMKWRMSTEEIKKFKDKNMLPAAWKETFNMEKTVASTGKTKLVAGGLSRAITSVMHLLATDWEKTDIFSDLFVLSDEFPINVGYDYEMENNKGILSLGKTKLENVVINPDSQFYMDAFLNQFINMSEGKFQNFNDEQKNIVIRLTNMLWLAHAGQTEELEMITGLVQQQGITQSGSGLVVAGGAIIYEDSQINESIGTFLTGLIDKSDKELIKHPKIIKAMDKAKKEQNSFKRTLDDIDDPISIESNSINSADPVKAAALANLTATNKDAWSKMNRDLKSASWAAPYLGVYYQGGMRAGIWPLMAPTTQK